MHACGGNRNAKGKMVVAAALRLAFFAHPCVLDSQTQARTESCIRVGTCMSRYLGMNVCVIGFTSGRGEFLLGKSTIFGSSLFGLVAEGNKLPCHAGKRSLEPTVFCSQKSCRAGTGSYYLSVPEPVLK